MRGDPVLERIIERFTPEDWAHPNGYKTASPEELAAYLDLPVEDIYWRPPAFGTTVLDELATWRQMSESDDEEWSLLDKVVWAWRHHMDVHGVNYRVSSAGLEAEFDDWLADNLDALTDAYPVRVVRRQHVFKNRRRLDFLCEFTQDTDLARQGDLLVIENKAHLADSRALVQLAEYVELVESEIASEGQTVEGLLICDGTTVELQHALQRASFPCAHMTLSELGYRDHLYKLQGLNRVIEPDVLDISDGIEAIEGPPPEDEDGQ
jgi:hypothetical protein